MTAHINPAPELSDLLKQLRLSGMLETLATRNREAIESKLTYPDFLTVLVQDEVARRNKSRFDSRIKKAGFRNNKTIENFDFNFNPKIDERLIKDIATCRFIQEKVAVILKGSCGTGKSHLAQAIGFCAVCQGHDVRFLTQANLLAQLHQGKAVGNYSKVFNELAKVSLLIIDDFGLKPLPSPDDDYLHELIAARYEQVPILITSNLDIDEWLQVFSNQLLGAATIDRLRHGAYQTELIGNSYRCVNMREKNGK